MKIVAFLQNQWFKDPERMKTIIARTVESEKARGGKDEAEVRDFYISTFLFWGCVTGRRLRDVFGEKLCEKIIWQEQSPQIGGKASAAFPADIGHIRESLTRHDPTLVLALGKLASTALRSIAADGVPWTLLTGPHPAARHATVMDELRSLREQIG